MSPLVQPLPSLQVEPASAVCAQVPSTAHASAVQVLPSSQLTVPVQLPDLHASLTVQIMPSVHGVASVLLGLLHVPVLASHAPALWHWSLALHTMLLPPVHAPLTHLSVCVQALPSLHVAASALLGVLHLPLAESQLPASWHWSSALHTTGFPPLHAPVLQVSVCVHRLPSSHGVASPTGA